MDRVGIEWRREERGDERNTGSDRKRNPHFEATLVSNVKWTTILMLFIFTP